MHRAVDLVVDAVEDGNVKLVSGEDLVGLIDEVLSFFQPLGSAKVVIDFPDVDLRNPGVGVNNGENDFIRRNCQFIEVKFLDMFNAPTNVTGFPLLLVLPD